MCVVPLTQGEEPGASRLLAAATLPTFYTHTYIYTDTYCGTNRERRGAHQGVFWRAKASQAKQSQSGTSSDRPPFFLCCVLVCLCVCLASWSWHDMKDEDVECFTWRVCACVEVGQPITRTWERRAQEQEGV